MQRRKKAKKKKRTLRPAAKRPAPRKNARSTRRPKPAAKKRASSRKPSFNKKTDSAYDPAWVAPVWTDDILLGAHVSTAGGVDQAPPRARAIGASAMQVFTKMANRWAERDYESTECEAFSTALGSTRVRATMAHDSYLINLASPDETLRRRSIESFVAELRRCEALGLSYLVSHPGNYMDDLASGLARNAEAIGEALERVPGRTVLCLETTSGSGTSLGASFEELAALIGRVPEPHRQRVGVCIDTCHVYSAGYDLVNAYDEVWARLTEVMDWSRVKVLHLNDSKTPFASKRDRHELIAEGSLGERPFRRIMTDERFARVPKVIETPKGTDGTATDARMLARLRSYLETSEDADRRR
jgi:deoxyribonuclease-4